MANALDQARRQAIAGAFQQAQLAYALDHGVLAIYGGKANPDEVAALIREFLRASSDASSNLISGLLAICDNPNMQADTIGKGGGDG